jgi:hypothetical protein
VRLTQLISWRTQCRPKAVNYKLRQHRHRGKVVVSIVQQLKLSDTNIDGCYVSNSYAIDIIVSKGNKPRTNKPLQASPDFQNSRARVKRSSHWLVFSLKACNAPVESAKNSFSFDDHRTRQSDASRQFWVVGRQFSYIQRPRMP